MSITERALYHVLTTDAGVSALVGSRVVPHSVPQATAAPYVTYQVTERERANHLSGNSGLVREVFTIGCWSEVGYLQAINVAAAVRTALDGISGTLGAVGQTISAQIVRFMDESDEEEDREAASDRPAFGRILTFQVWRVD